MEWLWYIIAALGAGVGTGLVGLSAATVMVPILIVLCPSFAGETGAYQATAVALASDILGSAVATYTYAKHKNIDLKRGWLIMACILIMSAIGSYAAFLTGNVVLGGFTLILTVCIGIRFLVKPDSTRQNPVEKGSKLGLKGIILSLNTGALLSKKTKANPYEVHFNAIHCHFHLRPSRQAKIPAKFFSFAEFLLLHGPRKSEAEWTLILLP